MDHTQEKVTEVHNTNENLVFPTVHNIYNGKVNADDCEEDGAIVTRSPSTRRSKINRLVYAKLHKKSNAGSTIDKLKGKYENTAAKPTATLDTNEVATNKEERDCGGENKSADLNNLKLKKDTVEQLKNKYSPASFGYTKVVSKIPKKVQFSNSAPTTQIPIPKPRTSLNNKTQETVIIDEVKVDVIVPEEASRVYASTSTLNSTVDAVVKDENSNDIEKSIDFAEPEDKHFIARASSSEDSITQVEQTLSEFVMDGKVKEKKRSNSFRKILSGNFFGSKKSGKKQEKSDTTAFNRNSAQRHTIGGSYGNKDKTVTIESDRRNKTPEELFAEMHINKFNDIRNNFARYTTRPNFPAEEYVCMDNIYKNQTVFSVDRYIDTSSSTSTLESEKQHNTYENSLIAQAEMRQVQQNENLRKTQNRTATLERLTETPPRAHETYQNLQLVKPKAVIPINSERALPNPYQDTETNNLNRNENKQFTDKNTNIQPYFEETYGTVFDSIESVNKTKVTPRSPSLEGSKLRLPSNRERIELQPRIKSPIPQTKISTDKLIATELLKGVRSPTPTRKSQTSHQRLEIQIDYPDNVERCNPTPKSTEGKPPISPKKDEWQKMHKGITHSPNQFVANAVVHAESNGNQQKVSPVFDETYRATTPINQRLSTSSLKSSPEKHEIRQQVEAYCWKELKKLKELKEREERDLYYYQLQTYGYADDGVLNRRSRSLTPNVQRGGRRSLSLPREVAPMRSPQYSRTQQPIPEGRPLLRDPIYGYLQQPQFVRNSPERRTIGPIATNQQKPIFNRGSLSNQEFYENQSSLKKVSFSPTQNQDSWPTRNGYTQSPPQRRFIEKQRAPSVEDEVFLSQNVPLRYANDPRAIYGNQPQVKLEEIYIQKTVMNERAPKEVRVSNKICDNYGQIHDAVPKAGVMYGQLQPNPVLRQNFVRGSRLTASANDMYKRYQNVDPRYRSDVVFQPIYETRYQNAPNRPLPPVPNERSTSLLPTMRQQQQYSRTPRINGGK